MVVGWIRLAGLSKATSTPSSGNKLKQNLPDAGWLQGDMKTMLKT